MIGVVFVFSFAALDSTMNCKYFKEINVLKSFLLILYLSIRQIIMASTNHSRTKPGPEKSRWALSRQNFGQNPRTIVLPESSFR